MAQQLAGNWRFDEESLSPPSDSYQVAYDRLRGELLMWESIMDETVSPWMGEWEQANDFWAWDGSRVRSVSYDTNSGLINFRPEAHLVYDSNNGVTYFCGGGNVANTWPIATNELWQWDGRSFKLIEVTDDDQSPPALHNGAVSFDSSRGRLVVFGGAGAPTGTPGISDALWEWSTKDKVWYDRSPGSNDAGVEDAPAHLYTMKWFTMKNVVSPFCLVACLQDNTESDELWEWDGTTWSNKTLASEPRPSARQSVNLSYDYHRNVVVLFGGHYHNGTSSEFLSDTWEWDGTAWSEKRSYQRRHEALRCNGL